MPLRILVNGANGKMGQITVKTLSQQPNFTVVGATHRGDNLAEEIKKSNAQIVVDLTNADAVLKNIQTIIDAGVHPVIGTSGLVKEQIIKLQEQCAQLKLGGLIVPNFSLGAILMMKCAQEVAKYFPNAEIIEMHHDGKLDSPSGTAVRTAEMIAEARVQLPAVLANSRETIPGARGAHYQQTFIHAVRLPGMVAHQQVIFGGLGETFTLRHDAIDRQCFMAGMILACSKVSELKTLVCGLEHVL